MLKELCTLPSALYRNRRLVKKMAKNDQLVKNDQLGHKNE